MHGWFVLIPTWQPWPIFVFADKLLVTGRLQELTDLYSFIFFRRL